MINAGIAALAGLIGGLAFLVIVWDAVLGGIFEVRYLRELGVAVRPGMRRLGSRSASASARTASCRSRSPSSTHG